MASKLLNFGVLGPLQLTVDGAEVPLGAPKQRAVLAMLVTNRNRVVAMDSLLAGIWGESSSAGARASIQTYVSALRKLLAGVDADPQQTLASKPPGYRLSIAEDQCDLGRFINERNAGVHAAAAGQFAQAAKHLSAALAQWRGPVLDDLRDFPFVGPFAAALLEDQLGAVTARAEAEIACGRASMVIGELESLCAQHAYREPLWAQLISAYYLAERQSDALDAHRRLKAALADDLGVDPGPSIRSLHEKVLRQESLDTKGHARAVAAETAAGLDQRTVVEAGAAAASLVDGSGRRHPLEAVATRIGRLPDNDIVLDDVKVSRHHAAVIDSGTSFVISDLRSANGVEVQHVRIRGSATLADGDHIGICGHDFTFELRRPE